MIKGVVTSTSTTWERQLQKSVHQIPIHFQPQTKRQKNNPEPFCCDQAVNKLCSCAIIYQQF